MVNLKVKLTEGLQLSAFRGNPSDADYVLNQRIGNKVL